jgi:RNA polymerase sigma-70 factor (ECF subfamily)
MLETNSSGLPASNSELLDAACCAAAGRSRAILFPDEVRGEVQRVSPAVQQASGEDLDLDCEGDLVLRLKRRDATAFAELVNAYGPRLMTVARRILQCEQESCDAVQDAFLSAFQSFDSFRGDAALGTWLHRIVANACLMRLRSRRRWLVLDVERLSPRFDLQRRQSRWHAQSRQAAPDHLCDDEMRRQVRACIDRLPANYREILILRDLEELDTSETAELLGVSESLVKTRLHRGRLALRNLLAPLLFASED